MEPLPQFNFTMGKPKVTNLRSAKDQSVNEHWSFPQVHTILPISKSLF